MKRFVRLLLAAVAAFVMTAPGHAATMDRDAYRAEKDRIEATHDSARRQCDTRAGNAKDVCEAEAKRDERVALAELDARNENTAEAREKVQVVRAEAEYEVARERCDDRAGNAKEVCLAEAKATEARTRAAAQTGRTAGRDLDDRTRAVR